MTKLIKNIQYKDTKFRLIETINYMLLQTVYVNITFYVSSYTGMFLNIIISNIDAHSVYLSYTLRVPNLQTKYTIKEANKLLISKVKCIGKFDQGSIPELDSLFIT